MRKLLLAASLMAMLLLPASQAAASSHHPTGAFADFDECPLNTEAVQACVFSESNGGYFTVGSKTVPLVNPVILQGGLEAGAGGTTPFVGAENGETLSKTPQPVPGGLLGIVAPSWWPKWLQNWFNQKINNGLTGVSATVELAAPGERSQSQHAEPDHGERHCPLAARENQAQQRDPGQQLLHRIEFKSCRDRIHDRHHVAAAAERTDHR